MMNFSNEGGKFSHHRRLVSVNRKRSPASPRAFLLRQIFSVLPPDDSPQGDSGVGAERSEDHPPWIYGDQQSQEHQSRQRDQEVRGFLSRSGRVGDGMDQYSPRAQQQHDPVRSVRERSEGRDDQQPE